jgi:hypothetical protein
MIMEIGTNLRLVAILVIVAVLVIQWWRFRTLRRP